jgi:hypothetical protein
MSRETEMLVRFLLVAVVVNLTIGVLTAVDLIELEGGQVALLIAIVFVEILLVGMMSRVLVDAERSVAVDELDEGGEGDDVT